MSSLTQYTGQVYYGARIVAPNFLRSYVSAQRQSPLDIGDYRVVYNGAVCVAIYLDIKYKSWQNYNYRAHP